MEYTTQTYEPVSQRFKAWLSCLSMLVFLGTSALQAQVIQIGGGIESTGNFPITTMYAYNYSQTIYTLDELLAAGAQTTGGTITKLMYLPSVVGSNGTGSSNNFRTWTVYMGNTVKEGFQNTSDWISIAQMTQVFSGDIPQTLTEGDWMEITLDTPFNWFGNQNLVIGVLENTPGFLPNVEWASYTLSPSSGNKGISKYNNSQIIISNPDPAQILADKVAQIRLDGSFQSGCTGMPEGGTLPANIGVCPGLPLELNAIGATSGQAGLVYQWEYRNSTTGNNWQDLPGADSNPYTLASAPAEITNYRLRVSCGTDTAYSTETTTYIRPPGECYCTPGGMNSNYYIDDFSTSGGVQNISNLHTGFSSQGYGDYTYMTVSQYQGDPVDFEAVLNQSPLFNYGFKIWVDWNGDGNLQMVYQSTGFRRTHTGSFTVPLNAALGNTRMRIGISADLINGPDNPCDIINGEFEDYTFEVLASQNCTGTPDGGTITPDMLEICESRPFEIETEGYTVGQTGLSGQWQYRNTATGGAWQDISGETIPVLQVEEAPGINTEYRYALTCSHSGQTGYSNIFELKIKPPQECYCIPISENPADYIRQFITDGADADISYTAENSGGSGYKDKYDSISGSIQAGGAMEFSEAYFNGEHGFSIWVDLNQDGIFEESERLYDAEEILWSHAGEFVIPQSTAAGDYRMRIRAYRDELSPDPCGEIYMGDAVDFKLIVLAACPAEVLTAEADPLCGIGPVDISVTANLSTAQLRLYENWVGGTPLSTAPGNSGILTTPSLSESKVFYVAAVASSGCESERIPVEIQVGEAPSEVNILATEEPLGSGENYEYTRLQAEGGSYETHAYKDDFTEITTGSWDMDWSGFGGYMHFGFSNSNHAGGVPYELFMMKDTAIPGATNGAWWMYPYDEATESELSIDISSFESLSLDFKYSFVSGSGGSPTLGDRLSVMVSTDGVAFQPVWQRLATANISMAEVHEDLSSYVGAEKLYIRFQYSGSTEKFLYWYIDDVLISGDKRPEFSWTPYENLFLDPELTLPYAGEDSTEVYAAPVCTDAYTLTALGTGDCEETDEVILSRATAEFASLTGNWDTANNWDPPLVPDIHKCVRVPAGNSLTVNIPDAEAGSIEVEAGGILRLTEGNALTVMGKITNEAAPEDFVVESDASLMQVRAVDNSGDITVQRKAEVPYLQFNYWTSPVKDMPLYELYPGIPSQYVMTYNTWDDYFTSLNPASNPLSEFGIGYAIMGPENGGPDIMAQFKGIPQNESVEAAENIIPLATSGDGFNLVGNPYPSNLDLRALYLANEAEFALDLEDEITPAFLFWDNTNNTVLYQQGSGYSGLNYAAYNPNADMGVPAQSGDIAKIPNGIVKPGQGFLVQASSTANGLRVSNELRTHETLRGGQEAVYYKNFEGEEAKFWIELKNPKGLRTITAVGYFEEAEMGFDKFDTPLISETLSDNLYSLDKNGIALTIQGREGPFDPRDVIPMGVRLYKAGVYLFDITQTQGIFDNMSILLRDKYLGLTHNLSKEVYKFYGEPGNYEDRFEIRFVFFGTSADYMNSVLITRQGKDIRVISSEEKILEVQLYNLMGWKVADIRNVNKNEIRIPAAHLNKQILIVNVKTESGEITSGKVVNKE